jgi:hypothetical protein
MQLVRNTLLSIVNSSSLSSTLNKKNNSCRITEQICCVNRFSLLNMNTQNTNRLLPTFALVTFPVLAFGYIDGATGSMLMQAAVSGILGLMFVGRTVLANLFRGKSKAKIQESEV